MADDPTIEVRQTLDNFTHAVESLELGRIGEFFEPDVQMFSPMASYPRRLDGRDAVLAQFADIIKLIKAQVPGGLKLEPYDVDARLFGDTALVTFHLRQPGPQHRRTFVMRKGSGRWRIAHIHASIASTEQLPLK